MVLFDWNKILRLSNRKVSTCFDIIWFIFNKEIPKNSKDPSTKYTTTNFSGKSFLINPTGLVKNYTKYSKRDIVEYVALAARRNLAEYSVTAAIHLPIHNAPKTFNTNNKLLYIKDNKIHFLYEEIEMEKRKNGTKF